MAGRRTPKYEIRIVGKRHFADRQVDCLAGLLRHLAEHNPDILPILLHHSGFRRRLIARSPQALRIKGDRPDLVENFAERVTAGWWFWSNWNGEQVLQNIRVVCALAGLEFGRDVIIRNEQWGLREPNQDLSGLDI